MVRLGYIATIISVALICVLAEDLYDSKYDDVNADEIIANDKLRDQYYKCFMDQAPCVTADAKFFREIIGEAYHTNCKKCTDKQKVMLNTVINYYKNNNNDRFKAFVEKTKKDLEKKA